MGVGYLVEERAVSGKGRSKRRRVGRIICLAAPEISNKGKDGKEKVVPLFVVLFGDDGSEETIRSTKVSCYHPVNTAVAAPESRPATHETAIDLRVNALMHHLNVDLNEPTGVGTV